jgi:hypothetical protein
MEKNNTFTQCESAQIKVQKLGLSNLVSSLLTVILFTPFSKFVDKSLLMCHVINLKYLFFYRHVQYTMKHLLKIFALLPSPLQLLHFRNCCLAGKLC